MYRSHRRRPQGIHVHHKYVEFKCLAKYSNVHQITFISLQSLKTTTKYRRKDKRISISNVARPIIRNLSKPQNMHQRIKKTGHVHKHMKSKEMQ